MDLQGATVVVTGGAIRVGRHVAGRLAERGANIVVNYRTSAREAEGAVAEFRGQGVGSLAVQADVSTHAGVQAILDAATGEFGSVEVLINNASIYAPTPFGELDEADFDRNRCDVCHQADECSRCHQERPFSHFGAGFGAPTGPDSGHGALVQRRGGTRSCRVCHEPDFCASCHSE